MRLLHLTSTWLAPVGTESRGCERPLPQTHNDLASLLALSSTELSALRRKMPRLYRKKVLTTGRTLRIPPRAMREIQRRALNSLRPLVQVSVAAMAVPGAGAVCHATRHISFGWCLTCDVHSCFASVRRRYVERALVLSGLGADAATALCDLVITDDQLPQGVPTSPWLLDVILRELDDAMLQRATDVGGAYSRYVDDIAISAPKRQNSLRHFAERRLKLLGLSLKPGKTRTAVAPAWASITGIEVSDDLRPSQTFIKNLKHLVDEYRAGSEHHSLEELEGRLSWVQQVNPRLAAQVRSRLRRAPAAG